jgi:hypothetical protein
METPMYRTTLVPAVLVALAACAPRATTTTAVETPVQPVAATAAPAPAMAMPSRETLIADVRRSRDNVLKYLDAAPDSMLGFRPVAGVRSFGEQIEHAAVANPLILTMAFTGKMPAMRADTATYRRSKPALRQVVVESYDQFERMVRDATDADLTRSSTFAGMTRPGWQWVTGAIDHSSFTIGQTVPYLRLNKVTPPTFLPF